MRIVFDIDGVLADFPKAFIEAAQRLGYGEHFPDCATKVSTYNICASGDREVFSKVWKQVLEDDKFWLSIPAFPGAAYELYKHGIRPDLYLTSRPVGSLTSAYWLKLNNFPEATVITVKDAKDKINYLEEGDIFVDDLVSTVRQVKNSGKGVHALLWKAPYQVSEDTRDLTVIDSFAELRQIIDALAPSNEVKLNRTKSYGPLTPIEALAT